MQTSLALLRQAPQPSPAQFLAAQPGCWIQYHDDTRVKNPAKTLRARSFRTAVAAYKQRERCAVCFSLQAFGGSLTREGLLCYRNLGVDVDLAGIPQRRPILAGEMDARKNAYLESCLQAFPLKPHWLIETQHGFHAVFRILPQRSAEGIRAAARMNRRLIRALRGNEDAPLVTQILRVPGTYQFKDAEHPFLCRLMTDNASTIVPYSLEVVASTLDAWAVSRGIAESAVEDGTTRKSGDGPQSPRSAGVQERSRTATAAAIVGEILGRLPERIWDTAGWGGLREWNRQNLVPLPEQELRLVYQGISRRERAKRRGGGADAPATGPGRATPPTDSPQEPC